jgi:hypothetical protein
MVIPAPILSAEWELDKVTICLLIFFLLAAEGLNKILSMGIRLGHFEGLCPLFLLATKL